MNVRDCRRLARLSCLACLATGPAPAIADPGDATPPAAYDHYDPVRLNERAVEYVREGRLASARILLERAARLAPFDDRVTGNLRVLKAHQAGERPADPATPVRPAGAAASAAASPLPASPEPPALWPARPEAR